MLDDRHLTAAVVEVPKLMVQRVDDRLKLLLQVVDQFLRNGDVLQMMLHILIELVSLSYSDEVRIFTS